MRTHQEIIRAVGPAEIAKVTDRPITTVNSWLQRKSIPAPQWKALVDAGFASADELIACASERAA